jgi:phenylpropionate dioxygenase-like ring-hydroxylating dioxygenase large terminal subunit
MTHGQIGAARPQAQFDTQQQVNFPFKADEARYKEYGVYVTRDGRWWKRLVVHRTEPTKRNGLFYSRFWWPQTTRTEVGENYMAFAFGVLPNDHVERSANGFWFTIRDPHGSTKSPVPRDYVESDVRVVE